MNTGIMPAKIELTLEQSQQGVSNDVLVIRWWQYPIPAKVGFITTCLRIKKAQELKTKTSANFDIQDLPLRYQFYQGRLLASFQDDTKYEHVGQDTRSQGGKDVQDKQGKDLKISDIKTKSKYNDKG
ncbi:hypothetical protein Tco_0829415 [Tanacetum coccineum]